MVLFVMSSVFPIVKVRRIVMLWIFSRKGRLIRCSYSMHLHRDSAVQEVRRWNWPCSSVVLTPVVLTHAELKKPSVFRMKTSEAHPNIKPQKHRHSNRPVARVRQYLTLMVLRTRTQVENSQMQRHAHKKTRRSKMTAARKKTKTIKIYKTLQLYRNY